MKTLVKLGFLPMILLMAGGCPDIGDDPDTGDTGDTDIDKDCPSEDTISQFIDWNCDVDAGTYFYEIENSGWTSGAHLYVAQTGTDNGWAEGPHEFTSIDYGDDGVDKYGYDFECYDIIRVDLDIVSSPNDVVLSETTLFQCDEFRKSTLSFGLVVFGSDGNVADCGIWGDDPVDFFVNGIGTGAQDRIDWQVYEAQGLTDWSTCYNWNAKK